MGCWRHDGAESKGKRQRPATRSPPSAASRPGASAPTSARLPCARLSIGGSLAGRGDLGGSAAARVYVTSVDRDRDDSDAGRPTILAPVLIASHSLNGSSAYADLDVLVWKRIDGAGTCRSALVSGRLSGKANLRRSRRHLENCHLLVLISTHEVERGYETDTRYIHDDETNLQLA